MYVTAVCVCVCVCAKSSLAQCINHNVNGTALRASQRRRWNAAAAVALPRAAAAAAVQSPGTMQPVINVGEQHQQPT